MTVCANAIDINDIFGVEVGTQLDAGPFSNVDATGESELAADLVGSWFDPLDGELPSSVDQSVWFKFTGNGNTYQLMTPTVLVLPFTATTPKLALYSGTCDDLEL